MIKVCNMHEWKCYNETSLYNYYSLLKIKGENYKARYVDILNSINYEIDGLQLYILLKADLEMSS
jgi:hypothetical protein